MRRLLSLTMIAGVLGLAPAPALRHAPLREDVGRSVFTCASRTTGVTCRNPNGHGMFISRESYRVW